VSQRNAFANIMNMIVSPAEALRNLKTEPAFWLPLILLVGGTVATVLVYYSGVDVPWLMQQQLEASGNRDPAAAEQARAAIEQVERIPGIVVGLFSAIAAGVVMLVIYALYALYLRIVATITKDHLPYKLAFSLVVWTAVPALLGIIATLANLSLTDIEFLPPNRLNPLSFSSLLGLDTAAGGLRGQMTSQAGPANIWALALLVLGHSIWTEKGLGRSALIVLAPPAVLYGLLFLLLPGSS
jgi:hypothetical protein